MNITCDRKSLLNQLRLCINVTQQRSTLPVLGNVLIKATSKGKIEVTGCNLDQWMTITETGIGINDPGEITLPARRLHAILAVLDKPEVTISTDAKNYATVKCGAQYKIMGLSAEEFAPIPNMAGAPLSALLDGAVVKDTLHMLDPFICTDEARYVLNGILLRCGQHGIEAVATNGRVLAMRHFSHTPVAPMDVIVASAGCRAFTVLDMIEAGDECNIRTSESFISFTVRNVHLVSKRVEGNFPNYKQIIPDPEKTTMIVHAPAKEFCAALSRLETVADSGKILFRVKDDGKIEFICGMRDTGCAKESFACKTSGKAVEIAVDASTLRTAIERAGMEEVKLKFEDARSPLVLENPKDDFLFVQMPHVEREVFSIFTADELAA